MTGWAIYRTTVRIGLEVCLLTPLFSASYLGLFFIGFSIGHEFALLEWSVIPVRGLLTAVFDVQFRDTGGIDVGLGWALLFASAYVYGLLLATGAAAAIEVVWRLVVRGVRSPRRMPGSPSPATTARTLRSDTASGS